METANLCPRSEAGWFEANGMGEYNQNKSLSGDYIVDNICNAIADGKHQPMMMLVYSFLNKGGMT